MNGMRNWIRLIAPLALLVLNGLRCGPLRDIEPPDALAFLLGAVGGNRIGVLSSDLGGAGRFGLLSPEGTPQALFTPVHSDATMRFANDRVYVINRLNRDNIQVLNPALFYQTELEFSLGSKSNPHDFAWVDPGKAYATLYARSYLAVLNPSAGVEIGRIDLSPFADPFDGLPEQDSLHYEDGRLYVTLQRLNQNDPVFVRPPTDASYLLEIDVTRDVVVAVHTMQGLNPFSKLRRAQFNARPALYWTSPGFLGFNFRLDGGVESFDLQTRALRPGFLYAETVAGGDILDAVIKNDTAGYAIVSFADFSVAVQKFNPATGQFLAQLAFYPGSAGFVSGLLLTDQGLLYVGVASSNSPGIMIYDTNQGDRALTPAPVVVGLRPMDLVYIP